MKSLPHKPSGKYPRGKGSKARQTKSAERKLKKNVENVLLLSTKTDLASKTNEPENIKPVKNSVQHIRTLLLERTWLDPVWRKKWRKRWGKNKWKPSIRDKFIKDQEWRRKWMKRLINGWWNKRWRRKWREKFLDERWIRRYDKELRDRRKFWKYKWVKSGYRQMGLTFNEFLITQRNLRFMIRQRKYQPVVNKNEKFVNSKEDSESIKKGKRKKTFKVKVKSWLDSLAANMKKKRLRFPRKNELNFGIIQFNLYFLNMCHGIAASVLIWYIFGLYGFATPDTFALTGLFFLLVTPSALDVFGSIFGMLTAMSLQRLRGHGKKGTKSGFFCNCGKKRHKKLEEGEELHGPSDPHEKASLLNEAHTEDGKRSNRKRKKRNRSLFSGEDESSTSTGMTSKSRAPDEVTRASSHQDSTAHSHKPHEKGTGASEIDKKPRGCHCKGFWKRLSCRAICVCFRPGKSVSFINHMGCLSYILLQLAWFGSLFFTGYYVWISRLSEEYNEGIQKCSILPPQEHCYKFDQLYFYSSLIVASTFMIRNILQFFIGMCISERHLKRTESQNPKEKLPSTCSDTDIDYHKVPKQMLVPYLLSHRGRYPYKLPKAWMYPYKLSSERKRKRYRHRNATVPVGRGRHGKPKKRLLSAQEKQAKKAIQGFKGIRRATVPLKKGRRRPLKLPVPTGVPDNVQLPPELLTMQARRWLTDDEIDSSDIDTDDEIAEKYRTYTVRKRRWDGDPEKVNSLILLHDDKSDTNLSITDVIKPKFENLDERISTDETWSGSYETMFDSLTDDDDSDGHLQPHRKKTYEEYLEMMVFNDKGDLEAAENAENAEANVPI